jgi:SMI1 / KNR4 family (SUKH-1)
MSFKELDKLLIQLEQYWIQNNTPIIKKFQPGIVFDVSRLEKFTGQLPLQVDELYKWKNGLYENERDLIGNVRIFHMGFPLRFDEILVVQSHNSGEELGWDGTMLPLFESGGGEYFLIDCNLLSESYGRIFYHSIGAIDFDLMISIYDSLFDLFLSILECNKQGIYKYEGENAILEVNWGKLFEINKSLNPKSDFWYLYD